MGARVDGEQRVLEAGESFSVPAGARHTWWAAGEEETRVMVRVEPALGSEVFFETGYGLARDGKIGPAGQPHPLQIAVLLAGRHRGRVLASLLSAERDLSIVRAERAIATMTVRRLVCVDRR